MTAPAFAFNPAVAVTSPCSLAENGVGVVVSVTGGGSPDAA